MSFFTLTYGRSIRLVAMILLWLGLVSTGLVEAQTEAITGGVPGPGQMAAESTNAAPNPAAPATTTEVIPSATNSFSAPIPPSSAPAPITLSISTSPSQTAEASARVLEIPGWQVLAALMTFASLGGFLLYQTGLTRAKNCGQTSTLLLVGVTFALIGYWMGGFAVQTGGVGDSHAALAESIPAVEKSALDHELGLVVQGHRWGVMGSASYFLTSDPGATSGIALLFLSQAALLALTVAAALGAGLERGRLVALAIGAFLIGAFIYPLFANWVWGGGWLAELGREYDVLGHGFVDWSGAGVVHETAGTLALVIAMVIGPRYGRFGRDKISRAIPGHNVPFVVLGTIILLISWTATNASAGSSTSGLAAVNTLLAAAGGLLITVFLAAGQKRRPEPALLCRGLLGGAVASCGSGGLIDSWAAFVIGIMAGVIVKIAIQFLENRRIDDPVGAAAVHGAGGAWGVIAIGIFANGTAGDGFNGVEGPVRGLLFGGAWHQLAAQAIGCATGFVVVFILGYAFFILIQKIVGTRADLVNETDGLDWTQVGTLGYQGDIDPEETPRNG